MSQISLTQTQQNWLDHINNASEQKISLAHYAKQNNLHIKSLYAARIVLVKKGALAKPETNLFSNIMENKASETVNACRVILQNGIHIEFDSVELTTLFKMASQL